MAVSSCEESHVAYCISVLTDESVTDTQCGPQLATSSHSKVPNPLDNKMCLDAPLNGQNYIKLDVENAGAFSPCIADIHVEKGNSVMPNASETGENLKTEGPSTHLQRGLQRQVSLQIGEKLMQILMNDSFVLPKFISRDRSASERVHETLNTRRRKYKRSASFNSRKVVLLLSVLSIIGTMALICLTLRVRQIGDGSVHI